jgi:hypothetical protein
LLGSVRESCNVADQDLDQISRGFLLPTLQHRRDTLRAVHPAPGVECLRHAIRQKQHHVAGRQVPNLGWIGDALDQPDRGAHMSDAFWRLGAPQQVHIVVAGAGKFDPAAVQMENGIEERDKHALGVVAGDDLIGSR